MRSKHTVAMATTQLLIIAVITCSGYSLITATAAATTSDSVDLIMLINMLLGKAIFGVTGRSTDR